MKKRLHTRKGVMQPSLMLICTRSYCYSTGSQNVTPGQWSQATVVSLTQFLLHLSNRNSALRTNLYTGFTSQTFIHFNGIRFFIHQLKYRGRAIVNTLSTTSTFVFIYLYLKHFVLLEH